MYKSTQGQSSASKVYASTKVHKARAVPDSSKARAIPTKARAVPAKFTQVQKYKVQNCRNSAIEVYFLQNGRDSAKEQNGRNSAIKVYAYTKWPG